VLTGTEMKLLRLLGDFDQFYAYTF